MQERCQRGPKYTFNSFIVFVINDSQVNSTPRFTKLGKKSELASIAAILKGHFMVFTQLTSLSLNLMKKLIASRSLNLCSCSFLLGDQQPIANL
uniref:Uncharacterized protein n=1 Tax=Nelumbo nucifera TaxID=4432 RepID=A0A822Z000_NELNU|nr:TPA_asm: hypothetical protein HUJ06_007470 [Nelumbo nucifera]